MTPEMFSTCRHPGFGHGWVTYGDYRRCAGCQAEQYRHGIDWCDVVGYSFVLDKSADKWIEAGLWLRNGHHWDGRRRYRWKDLVMERNEVLDDV